MVELKLAMYIEFPRRMKSGIFVSSADCIELYELTGDLWNFTNPGMTSLAHPSPIDIGTTHGVYVLEEPVDQIIEDVRNFFLSKIKSQHLYTLILEVKNRKNLTKPNFQ